MKKYSKAILTIISFFIFVLIIWKLNASGEISPAPVQKHVENNIEKSTDAQLNTSLNQDKNEKSKISSDKLSENKSLILAENFRKSISLTAECLGLKNTQLNQNNAPTSEVLHQVFQNDLGEVVLKNEEKTDLIIQTSNTDRRRIKMELDYSGESSIVRRLKYYKQLNNQWVEQELSSEQSEDPTDVFISSLMADGNVIREEKIEKIYFQNGEDITYLSKDNEIHGFDFYHDGKKSNCKDLDSENFQCDCF